MVNIRATLERAEATGVLNVDSRRALEAFGKSLFFPRRSWPAILEAASALGLPEAELAALQAWLPRGRVDQKREDALAMLAAMCEVPDTPEPARTEFRFEWTNLWDEFVARSPSESLEAQHVIEELRLEGEQPYEQAKKRALLRLLARRDAERRELVLSPEDKRATLGRLRAARELFAQRDLDCWMATNGLDLASFERLIEDEARLETLARLFDTSLEPALLDELHLSGDYERLAKRAAGKKEALASAGPQESWDGATGPNIAALRLWFFEQHLRRPMPDDVDAFARSLGFSTLVKFDSALRREWLYLQLQRRRNAVT